MFSNTLCLPSMESINNYNAMKLMIKGELMSLTDDVMYICTCHKDNSSSWDRNTQVFGFKNSGDIRSH